MRENLCISVEIHYFNVYVSIVAFIYNIRELTVQLFIGKNSSQFRAEFEISGDKIVLAQLRLGHDCTFLSLWRVPPPPKKRKLKRSGEVRASHLDRSPRHRDTQKVNRSER